MRRFWDRTSRRKISRRSGSQSPSQIRQRGKKPTMTDLVQQPPVSANERETQLFELARKSAVVSEKPILPVNNEVRALPRIAGEATLRADVSPSSAGEIPARRSAGQISIEKARARRRR